MILRARRSQIITVLALICTLIISVYAASEGTDAMPVACSGTEAPRQAVVGFFDALCSGDTELADRYIGNYSGLGFSEDTSSVIENRLYNELLTSYSYSLSGELRSQSGSRCYVQTVTFTHLDLGKVSERFNELFPKSFETVTHEYSFDEIYDEDGGYRQELIDRAVEHMLDAAFAGKESYLVSENIDVEIEYSSHKWQIVVSDRLTDAILGGTEA